MSEFTTMVMTEHRAASLAAGHPARAAAYDFELGRRLARRSRWRELRARFTASGRRQPALGSGC